MTGLLNHLWQSSLFAIVAGLLTLLLRRNPARARYWLWFAASVKFLIPFSLLVDAGSRVEWRTAPAIAQPAVSVSMEQAFTAPAMILGAPEAVPRHANNWPIGLAVVWFCGSTTVLFAWWRQWRRIRSARRTARPAEIPLPIQAMFSPALLEPGVFGVFRPILLLPEGIAERLIPEQLDAIVAHELCHVRSYDNLAAAIHMLVEAIFWFHPLVWWIGKRLVDERERACDEEVLRMGSEPEIYAESILKVCEFYLESPLDCVSGITGSDLRKRIRSIMTNRGSRKLHSGMKLLLAAAGVATLILPIGIGLLNAPLSRAQGSAERPQFEVASIKPNSPGGVSTGDFRFLPGGRFTAEKAVLRFLIQNAYGLKPFQISGGPDWINSQGYDIQAKASGNPTPAQMQRMMQTLLEDRFKLKTHREVKELPVYALTVARSGLKLPEPKDGSCATSDPDGPPAPPAPGQTSPCGRAMVTISRMAGARIQGGKISMAELTRILSNMLGRTVIDKTGFMGVFDVHLEFALDDAIAGLPHPTGPPGETSIPSVFVALQEQLGLKLESTKGPVEVLIIDHVERPTSIDQAFFRNAMWSPQAFDVASIKPAPPGATERGITQKPGGRLSTSNATVKQLVYLAYQVMPPQVSGGPDWAGSDGSISKPNRRMPRSIRRNSGR